MDNDSMGMQIVNVDDLVLHEEIDPRRVDKLCRLIAWDGRLKDPILVAKSNKTKKLFVLDGATRLSAIKRLQCKHVAVQIVDYERDDVELHRWCHVLPRSINEKELRKCLSKIKGLKTRDVPIGEAEKLLSEKNILGYFKINGTAIILEKGSDKDHDLDKLNDVVMIYYGSTRIRRIRVPDIQKTKGLVFVPQKYTKEQILHYALTDGKKVPAGVTRHVIPGRILGLSIDLLILKSDIPLESKNVLLQDIIKEKLEYNRLRYYPEPVYVFS